MINAHADAIIALLKADTTPPALVVLKGKAPTGTTPPYVLLYFSDNDPEDAESRSLTGKSERFVIRAICHSVGMTESAALAVAQRVRTALLDIRPNVAGRNCFPIRREPGLDVQRDESTGGPVQDKVDTYRLESVPS